MKAARFYAAKDIRIEDIPEPEIKPGAVKIDIAWCGICGTDLHEYLDGPIFVPQPGHPHPLTHEEPPVTLGHEFSGVISEVGEGVSDLKVGDHVVVEPYVVCGECIPCKEGKYNLCDNMGFIGLAGFGGGLAEKIVVEQRWVHKIDDSVPLDEAAVIEPLTVAVHAVRISGAKAGDWALVGGAGPIGLLVAAVLKGEGLHVIISELADLRKKKAQESGVADYIVDPSKEDLKARVRELTNGVGADVAFECAGVNPVFDGMQDALKMGGVLTNVSIWGHDATVDMHKLVNKELVVKGTIGYAHDHPTSIKLVEDGKVDVKPFITGRIALEDLIDQGFKTLIDHKDTAVKILVHP
ncbi:MAG: 2,3-butanediol dehydrogenase [Microbacteriaceae bacterium]|jgi:(R,R)-butanediol dehydrogenase/meso-butanediol dehydrogenase/diacetyl reductase|nr:2,3-butanediol dehydrogenase [Microbacteriaceae bacterium]MCI1206743.1 2,3-butanediol dehydrogenase [Microbacteriaceae bacterium]